MASHHVAEELEFVGDVFVFELNATGISVPECDMPLQRDSPSLFLDHLFVRTAELLFVELACCDVLLNCHLQISHVILQQFVQRPGNLTSLALDLRHIER